jgi:hypothetical protein
LAITRGLRQIARETYEIAGAIVFWLDGTDKGSVSDIDREQLTIQTVPAKEGERVTRVSDWMQAFLADIDACFADPGFWSRP